jgi:hypothetical protein
MNRQSPTIHIPMRKQHLEKNFSVDAVYMWVNGNDPEWIRKKNNLLKDLTNKGIKVLPSAVSPARFSDNEELRYSLRSLEQFAPWIRNVYVVTDNQCPHWINPRTVNLISHQEIFPPHAAYPVFNCRPIEFCLHRIPGLAEHYIAFNDDVMLGKPIRKSDFFTRQGEPVIWGRRRIKTKNSFLEKKLGAHASPHQCSEWKAYRLISERFKIHIPFRLGHTPKAMTRTTVETMCSAFQELTDITLKSRFRSMDDISIFHLYSLYLLAQGIGKRRLLNHEGLLRDLVCGRISYLGESLGDKNFSKTLKRIRRQKPLTFCLNDSEDATDSDRNAMRQLLEDFFPQPSRFEK